MAQEPHGTAKTEASSLDTQTKSQIMAMIRNHIDLASAVALGSRFADVDVYSRGNSPGPVDQYTKGSGRNLLEEVSNPVERQVATGAVASQGATRAGG